jgi:hypothetical protein
MLENEPKASKVGGSVWRQWRTIPSLMMRSKQRQTAPLGVMGEGGRVQDACRSRARRKSYALAYDGRLECMQMQAPAAVCTAAPRTKQRRAFANNGSKFEVKRLGSASLSCCSAVSARLLMALVPAESKPSQALVVPSTNADGFKIPLTRSTLKRT